MLDFADKKPLPIELRMAESLREIQSVVDPDSTQVSLLPVAGHVEGGGSLRPEAYSSYFALIRSIQVGNTDGVAELAAVLAQSRRPADAGITIRMLNEGEFRRPGLREVRQHFASASLTSAQMGSMPARAEHRMRKRLEGALALIREMAPRAWADVSRITTEIIAAYGRSRGFMTFDGCSSLERYGSILVNMRRRRTPLVLAETLVHESAHSLLFALSCNDFRVLNPPSELHKSPLRIDPRPLDGIFHAVFVLARMHGFLAEIVLNPETSTFMRKEALKVISERRKNFLDGHSVLAEHAKLTEIGRELLEDSFQRVETATRAVDERK